MAASSDSSIGLSLIDAAAAGDLDRIDQLLHEAQSAPQQSSASDGRPRSVLGRSSIAPQEPPTTIVAVGQHKHTALQSFVNQRSNKTSALHWAARNGHDAVCQRLLEAKARPNCRGFSGDTPLHYAAQCGHLSTVQLLMRAKASPNCGSATLLLPLHYAAAAGHTAIVSELVEHVQNAASECGSMRRSMELLQSSSDSELVGVEIDDGDIVGINTMRQLLEDDSDGSDAHRRLLVRKDIASALRVAASNGHVDTVRVLVAAARTSLFDTDSIDRTVLFDVACAADTSYIADANTATVCATATSMRDAPSALAQAQRIPPAPSHAAPAPPVATRGSTRGNTQHCVRRSSLSEQSLLNVMSELIACNANVNARDSLGLTPLHLAAASGASHLVKLLLSHKAHLDATCLFGRTALEFAAARGRMQVVHAIVEAIQQRQQLLHERFEALPKHYLVNQQIRVQQPSGIRAINPPMPVVFAMSLYYRAIRVAVLNNRPAVVHLLLSLPDIDCNAELDHDRNTALHLAYSNNLPDVVSVLLAFGADSTRKNVCLTSERERARERERERERMCE
jgi:ankyrin repeat protein